MTAIRIDGQQIRVDECRVVDAPPPGEAVVRLRLAGVCRTDVELTRGYMGFEGVLGHEFVGRVLRAQDASWLGARVVGRINCGCGRCEWCMRGVANHCPRRTVLGIQGRDGCFQDRFLLPEQNLVRVPDAVPDELAVFAEPLAAACRVLEQVDLQPWLRVAVLGDGKLGLLCTLVLAGRVHSVTLFGRHPGRVPLPVNVVERAADGPVGERFDVVVEATGRPEGLAQAFTRVQPLGTVVLKTTCAGPHQTTLAPVVIDELRVVGSRCGPLEAALELLASGRLPLQHLVAARFPLEQGPEALSRAAQPGVLKVLLEGETAR